MSMYFLAKLLKVFYDLQMFYYVFLISLSILDLNILGGEGLNVAALRKFYPKESGIVFNQFHPEE